MLSRIAARTDSRIEPIPAGLQQCSTNDSSAIIEIDRLFAQLSQDGQVMMELDTYPFNRKFAWVANRFGVSWQMSLAD